MEPKDKQWASQEKKKELSNIMSIVSSLFFLGLPGYSEPTKWPMVTLSSGAAISPFLYMILFVFLSLSLFHTHTHTHIYTLFQISEPWSQKSRIQNIQRQISNLEDSPCAEGGLCVIF